MSPRYRTKPRTSWLLRIMMIALTGVGALAILHVTGTLELPLPSAKRDDGDVEKGPVRLEGYVYVPAAATNLKAFSKVRGVDLFDGRKVAWVEMPLEPERVESAGVKRTRAEVIGRVLRRDKPANRVFTEDDFFPPGTRPGMTAGVPPGKRAVRVAVARISGVHGLQRGDAVDLVYATSLKDDGSKPVAISGPRGAELEMLTRQARAQARVRVRVVARGAVVVEPVSRRDTEVAGAPGLMGGSRTNTKSVEELVLAMAPAEAVELMAAFEMGAQVSCLPRSGRSGGTDASVTPDLEPADPVATGTGPVRFVEIIDGDKRRVVAVPKVD